MKKTLLFLFLCCLTFSLLFAGCFAHTSACAEDVITAPYDAAVQYATLYPHRDVASGGEQEAAKYLSAALTSYGYTVSTPTFSTDVSMSDGSNKSCEYCHVIGKKDNGKGKTLLIGCYYGGYAASDNLGVGEGASAALSVGLTLTLANTLLPASLDYDLTIAFWGGMEVADDVHFEKCGIKKNEIALYVNFDCVAAGKSEYLYADDIPRSQEEYFFTVAKEQGVTLLSAPAYKKQSSFTAGNGAYSYLHLGILGANRCFLNEGVPCVSFIGGAWDYDSGLYRYPGSGEIEGSSLDTFKQIDEYNGAKEVTQSRLWAVAKVVIAGLNDSRLSAVLDKAASERTGADLDSDLAYRLIQFIGLAGVIVFFAVLMLKQKKDRRDVIWTERVETPNDKGNDPFEELHGEDHVDPEETQTSPRNDDGDDDIFRF